MTTQGNISYEFDMDPILERLKRVDLSWIFELDNYCMVLH